MKKNSMDIMKITEFFQKYGYNPRAKKSSGVNDLHFMAFVLVLKKEGSVITVTLVLAPPLCDLSCVVTYSSISVLDAVLTGGGKTKTVLPLLSKMLD